MNENVKKIITLLYKKGPLSKHELAQYGEMGWATVVKFINRLLKEGIIECVGTSPRIEQKGKNAYIYNLSDSKPLAIGIDIEYSTTTIILANLKGEIFSEETAKTPENPNQRQLSDFLYTLISKFMKKNVSNPNNVVGIGIGIPGIGIPSWIEQSGDNFVDISNYLKSKFGVNVVLEINTRAYTMFEKWDKRIFSQDDFLFLSIRTGVGTGIFIKDKLFTGYQGLAGELGHFNVVKNGIQCRCGKKGCLETEVNQFRLYQKYIEDVIGKQSTSIKPSLKEVYEGLSNLFSLAKKGHHAALKIITQTSEYLGYVLSHAIMVLNVPSVIISGHFGSDGNVILPILKKAISKNILSKINFNLEYYPFDIRGHTLGSALLILRDFLTAFHIKDKKSRIM